MRIALLLTGVFLVACGGGEKEADREGVFDPMVESIDKAKEVEDAVMKHKEEIDKRLKEMEGTTEDDE